MSIKMQNEINDLAARMEKMEKHMEAMMKGMEMDEEGEDEMPMQGLMAPGKKRGRPKKRMDEEMDGPGAGHY